MEKGGPYEFKEENRKMWTVIQKVITKLAAWENLRGVVLTTLSQIQML